MAERPELLALGANCVGRVSNDVVAVDSATRIDPEGPQCAGHRRRDDCQSAQARTRGAGEKTFQITSSASIAGKRFSVLKRHLMTDIR
jgi:hypothetical protein